MAAMFLTIPMTLVQYNNPTEGLAADPGAAAPPRAKARTFLPLLNHPAVSETDRAIESAALHARLQQIVVVLRMTGHNVGQCADRNPVAVGNPGTAFRLGRQRGKQSDRGLADALELGHQVFHATRV